VRHAMLTLALLAVVALPGASDARPPARASLAAQVPPPGRHGPLELCRNCPINLDCRECMARCNTPGAACRQRCSTIIAPLARTHCEDHCTEAWVHCAHTCTSCRPHGSSDPTHP